jgi:hypothetical protein
MADLLYRQRAGHCDRWPGACYSRSPTCWLAGYSHQVPDPRPRIELRRLWVPETQLSLSDLVGFIEMPTDLISVDSIYMIFLMGVMPRLACCSIDGWGGSVTERPGPRRITVDS